MKANSNIVIDFLAAQEAATIMSVEEWFDKYGVAIMKREEEKQRTGLSTV